MKTFQIGNFEIMFKLNNNKILIELIDLVSNNILRKEFNKEQIIVNVINPLDIKETNDLTTNIFYNLNITEIYNLCNIDNFENLKEYEFVDNINGYFLGNIENKHNKLSIIKNDQSIKLLFNCETNSIIQIDIIFEIDNNKTINSYCEKNKINNIEDKINTMEDKINTMEDKINTMEDKINNIKKYDIHLLPELTLNTIILTLIITGCISNMIKTIYKK
jgi:hypothetical protein